MGRLLLLDRETLTKTLMTFATKVINHKSIVRVGVLAVDCQVFDGVEASKWLFSQDANL